MRIHLKCGLQEGSISFRLQWVQINSDTNKLSLLLTHWPGRCGSNFESIIVKLIIESSSFGTRGEIALSWKTQNLTNEQSKLSQVIPLPEPKFAQISEAQWWV